MTKQNVRQEAREKSRAKIVETALTLFATTGYEGTSIRVIAQQAGISQGLMYNYFSSKEELLKEIFLKGIQDVFRSFPTDISAAPGKKAVHLLIRNSFTIIREHMDIWRLIYALRTQPSVLAVMGPEIAQFNDRIFSFLEGLLSQAGYKDPYAEARILQAIIDGVCQQYVYDPENYPLEAVTDILCNHYYKDNQ